MEKIAELADVRQATATWNGGQLRIQASGEVPESCWSVSIDQSPIRIWPPQFVATRRRTSAICAQVVTPFVVADCFPVGDQPESVVLHHAGGEMTLPVDALPGVGPGALPDDGDPGYDEAEGRSRRRFAFDEAFANAVEALPFRPSEIADWMDTVVVTEIRAELGGIAGSRDLVVRVRRPHPPS